MKALAAAIVSALAFLELSDDDVIDADSAVAAMESITLILSDTSEAERTAIAVAVDEAISRERTGRKKPQAIEFYDTFMNTINLS